MIKPADIQLIRLSRVSPRYFIMKMWGLVPERDNKLFIKGKHITWQQDDILQAVEAAIQGRKPRRISIASGHGIGKSTTLAWLILWYLFCFKDAQVPCTAPTSDQIHDILWKEVAVWLNRMPEEIKKKFEWTSGYIRMTESPETWFARAKTARKEAPEALAGVHGDFVMFIIDEASGVAQEIFNTAEGALTNKNILVLMISNPTRLLGYFYDSHHRDQAAWQTLNFDSEQSPIVDHEFVDRIIKSHGLDSDEFKIRVRGQFPKADSMDSKGFVPLLTEADLNFIKDDKLVGRKRFGVDPAGEGNNKTTGVVRDLFKAKLAFKESISTAKSIAQKLLTVLADENIEYHDTYYDNFGEGANVGAEVALAGSTATVQARINGVNVGDDAEDKERFSNLKAEAYFRLREWCKKGGQLVGEKKDWEQLLTIKWRRELNNKIKIMSKKEMREEGIASPDIAEALMLTFIEPDNFQTQRPVTRVEREAASPYGG